MVKKKVKNVKKGFWANLFQNLDKKMAEKAAHSGGCCCDAEPKSKNKKKGSSCCNG